ncbi:MAG TPA: nickel pincer cofactor biosynthesis protein LarB [archaeon]|nr:nickel pincer cofactor biosynthesis protein LarB [archaeon]
MNFDFVDVGDFGKIDVSKKQRTGIPEVVLCSGKTAKHIIEICKKYFLYSDSIILTKCPQKIFSAVRKIFSKVVYERDAKVLIIRKTEGKKETIGTVGIIAAGTADYSVAKEAEIICREFGMKTFLQIDVGVSSVQRLKPTFSDIKKFEPDMLIVVAGMEAALPTFLSGLVKIPIVAVPTSVGYQRGVKGLPALLSMLNSCAPGISAVNIDNGFGAAAFAYKTIFNIRRKEGISIAREA